MFQIIILPTLAVGAIGLVLGLLLAVAAKYLAVEVGDDRAERITAVLPGVNCGACGRSGCGALAEAIISGDAPATACPVSGEEAVFAILEALEARGVDTVI